VARGIAALRQSKRTLPVHPLERLLWERGFTLAYAARFLGMSLRSLKNTIAWRHRPRPERREMIANGLGIPADQLFPELPLP